MSRYIEVDKAMELCDAFYFTNETCSIEWLFKTAPSIDIVRCKECKRRKKNGFCLEHNRYEKNDNGYCSCGVRLE